MAKRPTEDEGRGACAAAPSAFRRRLNGKTTCDLVAVPQPSQGQTRGRSFTFASERSQDGTMAVTTLDLTEESEAFQASVCPHATAAIAAAVVAAVPSPLLPIATGTFTLDPSPPRAAPRGSSHGVLGTGGQPAVSGGPGSTGVVEERWFLGMGSKIVGVQHYNGVVSDHESVVLQRQPTNAFDRNAIQVLNARNQQIGHIPREMAAVLAPVMDGLISSADVAEELRFEGHVPRGSNNVFSMPLRIAVFGRDPSGRLAPRLRDLGERLQRTYCTAARSGVDVHASQQAEGTSVGDIDDRTWASITGGRPSARGNAAKGPSMHDVIERELEGVFRGGAMYEDAPEAETPESLMTPLYPHQRKALHWMMQRERELSIDQALSELGDNAHDSGVVANLSAASSSTGGRRRRTGGQGEKLPSQVFFWTKERAPNGTWIYKNLATNSAYLVAPRFPRGGILADDMGLGKTISVLALVLSDLGALRTARSAGGGGCLIVCPLSVLYNWSEQVRLHAPSLRLRIYHGSDRDRGSGSFRNHDIVLTTYDIVRAEARDDAKREGLGAVKWHRAVLDEAHVIKGHRSAVASAVCDLIAAERRWCLTGTPIQNSVEDVFSLARFLRLEPFDRFEWFNRTILRPLKVRDMVGFERLQVLLRMWCLRRTKDMRIIDVTSGLPRPLLTLPQKAMKIVKVPLDPADRLVYDRLFKFASDRVHQLSDPSELGKHFSQVLTLLMRLRQLCCSRALLPQALLDELMSGGDASRVVAVAVQSLGSSRVETLLKCLADAQEDDCSICMEAGCDVVTRCGHLFHRGCLEDAVKELGQGGVVPCPLCRQAVKKGELLEKPQELEVSDEGIGSVASSATPCSAKIRSVVSFLVGQVVNKCDVLLGKPHKAIVFSQFTTLLNILQGELEKAKVPLCRLDGSMTHDKRVDALQAFGGHRHVQVILCSLKAAGIGLNLTAADHVILIDPWWNPAVEDQAIDRAHRLGQRRPVQVIRYVAESTVEERILEIHRQKRDIMEGALSKHSRQELRELRLRTIASLFDGFK